MEIVDITDEILEGKWEFNPVFLQEMDIDELLSQDIINNLRQKPADDDADAANESEDIYTPSILDVNDANEISAMTNNGLLFREDEISEIPATRLPLSMLEEIAENPQVQSILNRMRPDQITPEIVTQLLRKN